MPRVSALILIAAASALSLPISACVQAPEARTIADRDGTEDTAPVEGRAFRDSLRSGGAGPEMVIVPAGSFAMGSPESETGRHGDEGPVRQVTISQPFAVGRFEVTRGAFAAFVTATGYDAADRCYTFEDGALSWRDGRSWRDPGFSQSDAHPVTCVDWRAASAYADWLSEETGEDYRLLSEAEWEYAARAGTRGRYHNDGDEAALCAIANFADTNTSFEWRSTACSDGVGERTAAVGSYEPNAFGLHDMHGNVWEWVADCWHASYAGAPSDGSAWTEDCDSLEINGQTHSDVRMLRGGSWGDEPGYLRAADRLRNRPENRSSRRGFRLARTL